MNGIKENLASKLLLFDKTIIKAVAVDIDGTLISSQQQCSERTEQALKRLIQDGKEVFLVTGRGTRNAMSFAIQCGIPNHMINYNGATVWNFQTNQREYENCISKEYCESMIKIIRKHNVLACAYYDDNYFYELENEFLTSYLSRMTFSGYKKNLDELPTDQFQKFIILADNKTIYELYDELLSVYQGNLTLIISMLSVHNPIPGQMPALCIEIMNKDANKGYALEKLLKTKGISLEETVAFGDDNNDMPMLSRVGFGVAMENAKPHIKDIAFCETYSNNDDGVAYFIEEYLL